MVLTFVPPPDHMGTLVYSFLRELIFESDGHLEAPEILRPLASNATSLDGMADRLSELLKQDREERDRQ